MAGKKLTKEEQIQKLLLKAQTTTPEEAEILTAKAEELMLKYGINRALLNASSTGDKERIQKLKIPLQGIYAKAYMDMMHSVALAFGNVRAFYTQWKQSDVDYTIVGFESDVSQLHVLLTSLQLQAVVALDTWAKSADMSTYTPMEKFKTRRTFIKAFGNGAATRIAKTRASAVKDAESTTPGAELVLRDRMLAIDDFMKSNVGKLRKSKSREKSGAWDASSAGYAAGKNANTGERQVNAGRRAIEA